MPQIPNYDLLTHLLTGVKSRDASASKKYEFSRQIEFENCKNFGQVVIWIGVAH